MAIGRFASPAVLTRPLVTCYGITGAVHIASISLSTLLPFHMTALGANRTQIGFLFSLTTVVSMVLRPAIGGWIDRFGATPLLVPGILAMGLTSVALQVAATPSAVTVVMLGVGLANALINTPTSVLTARASDTAHRGEAFGLYYLSSSLALAVAPSLAFGLRWAGGMTLAFVVVTGLVVVMLVLVLSLPAPLTAPAAAARSGFPALSRAALSVSPALVLLTIGHSSIYAFLPLYAVSRGQGAAVAWFYTLYSVWALVWRAALGSLSDRIGRGPVLLPAMALTALGFFALAIPPTPLSLMAAALLLGGGSSVLYPTLAALVLDRAPETERGLALGTLSASWDFGVVLGSAVIGFVADHTSFGVGFVVAGTSALGGTLVFLVKERRQLRPRAAPAVAPAR